MKGSINYLREIFNSIDVMVWAVEKEGTIVVSEGKALRKLELSPGQLVGQNVFEVYASDPAALANIREALDGKEATGCTTLGAYTLETHYAPIRDESGAVVAMAGITFDVSERIRLQEEREREATRNREQAELLDLAQDAILVRSVDGKILYWNKGAERVYGYSRAEAVGSVAQTLLSPRLPKNIAEIDRELQANGSWEGEISHTRRDGTQAIVSSRWVLKRDADGAAKSVLELNTDITARREAEEAYAQKQEALIRAQALAIAELSTPLIPISDEILVMPLVGVMDSNRVNQVMENLLNGLSSSRGQYAILDITGVSVVDTQVANALIRSAHAARLLGAEVILTGIRPEVAQTLVSLGAGLGEIVTCGTLQSGIAYALRRQRKVSLDSER